jgi:esterase
MDLYFRKIGNGPVIVVLHGLFGMSDNWMTLAKKMSADFCFYLIDMRNHGRSPHSAEFNYPVMAADICRFIENHNLTDVTLLGHSMGGKTAMSVAESHSHCIQKLVIVDISPLKYDSSPFYDFIDAMLSVDLLALKSRNHAAEHLQEKLNANTAIIQFLLKNLYRTDSGLFKWRLNLMALKMNINRILEGIDPEQVISTKTLFIKGSESNYILKDDSEQIKKQFPNSQIVTIENANHWVHAHAPVEFEKTLRIFLKNEPAAM